MTVVDAFDAERLAQPRRRLSRLERVSAQGEERSSRPTRSRPSTCPAFRRSAPRSGRPAPSRSPRRAPAAPAWTGEFPLDGCEEVSEEGRERRRRAQEAGEVREEGLRGGAADPPAVVDQHNSVVSPQYGQVSGWRLGALERASGGREGAARAGGRVQRSFRKATTLSKSGRSGRKAAPSAIWSARRARGPAARRGAPRTVSSHSATGLGANARRSGRGLTKGPTRSCAPGSSAGRRWR